MVDELHRPGLDAGHDQQPRAELPRLPEHRQPGLGSLHRCSGTLRSTLGANLVNEFTRRRLRRRDACSRRRSRPSQFSGTSLADQAGFLLEHQRRRRHHQRRLDRLATRRAKRRRKVVENTLNWLKGSHSIQTGGSFTRPTSGCRTSSTCRRSNFGVDTGDPANAMFTTANFPGASSAQLDNAQEPVRGADRPRDLDQRRAAARRGHRPVRVPRPRHAARTAASTTASSSPTPGACKPNFTVNARPSLRPAAARSIRATTATRRRRSSRCGAIRRRQPVPARRA